MKTITAAQELFSLVAIEPPTGGDLVPAPGQQVQRIVNRAIQRPDGTIMYEQEIIYLPEPTQAEAPTAVPAAPPPTGDNGWGDVLVLERHWGYGPHPRFAYKGTGEPVDTTDIKEVWRAAHEGRLLIVNCTNLPPEPWETELLNLARRTWRQRRGLSNETRLNNGRIVLGGSAYE